MTLRIDVAFSRIQAVCVGNLNKTNSDIIFSDCVCICNIWNKCCARNLPFSRIQAVYVGNFNKTCSGPTWGTDL